LESDNEDEEEINTIAHEAHEAVKALFVSIIQHLLGVWDTVYIIDNRFQIKQANTEYDWFPVHDGGA
jgi:hypothetical protein